MTRVVDHNLPALPTVQQTAKFLQCSGSTVLRLLGLKDPEHNTPAQLRHVRVGAGVRIPRDDLLQFAGLASRNETRRNRRQSEAEAHAAAAVFGGT